MKKSVIIVAAGSGSRMKSAVPKQFIVMNSYPVLMHTIRKFQQYEPGIKIVVVLPETEINRWQLLTGEYKLNVPHTVIAGGTTRFDSVRNGLQQIQEGIVAIHDGVRPLVSTSLIASCFAEAEKFSNAVPVVPVSDTIRQVVDGESKMLDRSTLFAVQTPQCFDAVKLKHAYDMANSNAFTDDAGVFERAGNKIHLVPGEKSNIKITAPEDLVFAEGFSRE